MNKNINMYKQVESKTLSGKELTVRVLNSLRTWINDVTNKNLTHQQKLTALNNAITLSVIILENLNYEIKGEEREIITSIINLIIKKCSDSVLLVENLNIDSFKEETDSISLLIQIVNK